MEELGGKKSIDFFSFHMVDILGWVIEMLHIGLMKGSVKTSI